MYRYNTIHDCVVEETEWRERDAPQARAWDEVSVVFTGGKWE